MYSTNINIQTSNYNEKVDGIYICMCVCNQVYNPTIPFIRLSQLQGCPSIKSKEKMDFIGEKSSLTKLLLVYQW